jgi:transcriptional regulator with XRE-family HTH domain
VQEYGDVGMRLRAERGRRGLSLRELARRIELSASALSQIETGRSRPSVSTLYAIVSELGMSLDELFGGSAAEAVQEPSPAGGGGRPSEQVGPVQRADSRMALELESGVRWERLTPVPDREVDFLYLVYEVGGASTTEGLIRHNGTEYGLVLSGRLTVTVAFDDHELGSGDSISFDSTVPHRLANHGEEPAHAVWFVVGRDAHRLNWNEKPSE